ncbi:MAG: 30S ribosomal protein S4 [Clostridia bacterium]|nr:30S ribosomal protein S4 [Clostridia bacterium]MDH7571957.1 30S ribosomal protein S4 [Clostridia bacterium]
MSRYTGPVCRLCRREGIKLFLKAERCYTDRCAMERRPYPPGLHGHGRKKVTEYGMQLREKQKAKRVYGVLERQFRNYFERAERQKGATGENLLRLLERRLDNVVFRLGLAGSRPEARQLVRHGHFAVNGRKVDIPSYQVRPGDEIAVREGSRDLPKFKALAEALAHRTPPAWLEVDKENLRGRVLRLPQRDEIDVPVEEHLIVELYSR